ncbi:hypothetical protein FHS21_002532 [Phyllobacterium trifolii]|uniref:Uncharacterized protein n=1 Tax=Phyllobacterium trifolii TaxID=300193 RepID=A0A839U6J3_9HYPH|nr:hypothetical protein [Phyllobacterium trifolii]
MKLPLAIAFHSILISGALISGSWASPPHTKFTMAKCEATSKGQT